MTHFAKRGNAVACFRSEVDRDRFLDLTIGAKYAACEHRLAPDVARIFEIGGAYWMQGAWTYLNGDNLLERVYA